MTNPTQEDFEKIKTLNKGDVYIPIMTVGGVSTELDPEMIRAKFAPSPNNPTGLDFYREFSSVSPVIGQ
jgi:hypothetical protein